MASEKILRVTNSTNPFLILDEETEIVDASKRTKPIQITGNANDNSIVGGFGNDTVNGGSESDDTLTGGKGKDIFV